MKVSSFVRVGHELVSAEVELTLAPGLPQFSFMGLPDTALRESGMRVRSAIREQGFELPQAQQILVHIKPTFLKKTSRGLDLAIAGALLWETGQLALPDQTPVLYGELTLKGEVVQPDDVIEAPEHSSLLITGCSKATLPFPTHQINDLASMIAGGERVNASDKFSFTRPPIRIRKLPRAAAAVAKVVAAGEHSRLLAGPPGSGKSTRAAALPSWLEEPTLDQMKEVRHFWSARSEPLAWRPVLKPHHSITPLAMIGGGSSLWPGEITRAHGGLLVMDELLEFHPEIQEALREPVESGSISLVRAGASRTYPARVLLIGTTNLCACGNFVPRRSKMATCRCAKSVRRKILTRLTGPFVDRFALIVLTDEWDESDLVSVDDVAADVERAIEFRRLRGQSVPNSRLAPEVIEESLSDFDRDQTLKTAARSRRRRAALLRVARTLADLRSSKAVSSEDLEQARILTVQTHRMLEEWTD
jgi:magnesium chelatase family protein